MDNLALDLVNSHWWRGRADGGIDKLDDPEWVGAFAERLDLPAPADVEPLRELRSVVQRLIDEPGDPASLAPFVSRGTLRRSLASDGEVQLVPAPRDWEWAVSEIATSFLDLLAHGERERLKVCANEECGWSFYDASRNRSRRWCDAAACGNNDKVRRYRARQRVQA